MITRVEHLSTDGLRRAVVLRRYHARYTISVQVREAAASGNRLLPWEHVATYAEWRTRSLDHANGVAERWCRPRTSR